MKSDQTISRTEAERKPVRIQRRRAKGWRMPEGAVCVDRSTKWGNPFVISRKLTRETCVHLFRVILSGYLCLSSGDCEEQKRYSKMVARDIGELRGKDLACWCSLDQPCHADVLLEVANR